MSFSDKYEILLADNPRHQLARHVRLGRKVEFHRVDKVSRDDVLHVTASHLAKLDHPAIPHLIDFVDDTDSCILVFEACEDRLCASADPLACLGQLEQVASALGHARRRNIVHGDLRREHLRVNAHGELQLAGLGLRQIFQPDASIDELAVRDVTRLKHMIAQVLERRECRGDEPSFQVAAFQEFLEQAPGDIVDFSDRFRELVHGELAIAEAKKLSVKAVEGGGSSAKLVSPGLMATAYTAIALVVICLLAVAFWPRGEAVKQAAGPQSVRSVDVTVPVKRTERTVSGLANVGKLNNPNLDTSLDQSNADSEPDADSDPEASDTSPVDMPSDLDDERAVVEETPSDEPVSQPVREGSPFAGGLGVVDLPEAGSTEVVNLLSTDLTDEEPLALALLGGPGAIRHGEFAIQPGNEARTWVVSYIRDSAAERIAEIRLNQLQLTFAWFEGVPEESSHLRNAMLHVESGAWRHVIRLRKPVIRPAFRVDLIRNRPYELEIPYPPDFKHVTIEFVPSAQSPAEVVGPLEIPAIDGQMSIGLDAGKNSLLVLELESLASGKLRTKSFWRESPSAELSRIGRGFEQDFRTKSQRTSQALFTMKERLKLLNEKQTILRKQTEATIRQLEIIKASDDNFIETYLAARNTELSFKVYRQVDDHRLLLLTIGETE